MKVKNYLIFLFIFVLISEFLFAQENDSSIYMDFRNQKISDIIYSLSDLCGESVYIDETVIGNATFHFEDVSFESALNRFASYCQLYIEKDDGIYKISKVKLTVFPEGKVSVNTENVNIQPFLNMLSRMTNTTIMFDSLPDTRVTVRVQEVLLEDILNLVIVKLPGFSLERISSGFYLTKNNASSSRKNVDVFTVSNVEDKFFLSIQKASFTNFLESLFKKANREYSLLVKTNVQLEGLNYSDKTFDEVLKLVLEQANCDFTVLDGIYYIFEIQRKDVLKNLKQTKIVKLKNISVENLVLLLPSELNSASFIKTDKTKNAVILNGSENELKAIEDFILKIDAEDSDFFYKKFEVQNITVKDALSLLPKNLLRTDAVEVPSGNAFIALVNKENAEEIEKFLQELDVNNNVYEVRLKYIKSEELIKNLPPSVSKDSVTESSDSSLIFYKGNENQYFAFCNELEKIDRPKQQIRYELLVLQREKTSGLNLSSDFSVGSTENASGYSWSGTLSNVFNINFDIISQFGVQFAGSLNAELSAGKSHVLADTTLNGISGEDISFSNTNTYRYRDKIVDADGDIYTSVTREISSGLVLDINGWVSGEDMITVKVEAQVSKQGSSDSTSDTTNPPNTTEKKVSTNVRTKSGEPVIIGGLFQTETDVTEKRVPFLGAIPVLGNLFKTKVESSADTEFVIYLVPFVEKNETTILSEKENILRLRKKYEGR